MANGQLYNCSQCSHLIAASAPRCIGCGAPGDVARGGAVARPPQAPVPSNPPAQNAASSGLKEALPRRLERILQEILQPDEIVHVKLKGAFKEALVCTDRRVLILKAGWMTGQTFGSNVFQVPYRNVTGVQVKKHLVTGYFELSAGGVQNLPTSYWDTRRGAEKRENCISLNRPAAFPLFREASNFILSRANLAS